jgi:5-methylcytosine-specific restriction endonuclease McrA
MERTVSRADKRRRKTLRSGERSRVLAVTKKRCHICGGKVIPERWQADHVLAFSSRGENSLENYLPAHRLCNNYRWDYLSEEFQWILKMGVWSRTLMKNSSPKGGVGRERGKGGLGREMAEKFFNYEQGVKKRRKRS